MAGLLSACADGGVEVDPAQLSARDLLGLDPAIATRWDEGERAAARRVLDEALAAPPALDDEAALDVPAPGARRVELARVLDRADEPLEQRGRPPRLLWRLAEGRGEPIAAGGLPPAASDGLPIGSVRLDGWESAQRAGWGPLALRRPGALLQLAQRAGREAHGALVVEPVAQVRFAAAYVAESDRLLINPVLLAVFDPEDDAIVVDTTQAATPTSSPAPAAPTFTARAGGNPYNFYGSLGECAAAEQGRCESCLQAGSCDTTTVDGTDGLSECQTLAAESGRGYFLICANTAMTIDTVSTCVEEDAAACPRNEDAGRSLALLSANNSFVDDSSCRAALDACLAELYGSPDGEFPGPPGDAGPGQPDGGGGPGPPPPATRDVEVGCSDCESDNSCNFEPQCNASCGGCEDSESGGGGSSSCDNGKGDSACEVGCTESEDSSSSGGSGCGGCDCESESDPNSGSDSGGSCDSCNSSSDSGMSSDSGCDCSGDSSCGSDCGNCGSSDSSSSDSSSGCNSNCQAARAPRRGPPRQALLGALWGLLPLAVMAIWRRRSKGGVS